MKARAAVFLGLLFVASACSKASNETASDFDAPDDPGAVLFSDPSPSASATPAPTTKAASTGSDASKAPVAAPAPAQPARVSCPVGSVIAEVTEVTSDEMSPDPDEPSPPPGELWRVRVRGFAQNKSTGPVSDVNIRVEIHPSGSEGESASAHLAGPFGPGSTVAWSVTEEAYSEDDIESNDVKAFVRSWSWGDRALDQNCGH